jgi:hypothetical protein
MPPPGTGRPSAHGILRGTWYLLTGPYLAGPAAIIGLPQVTGVVRAVHGGTGTTPRCMRSRCVLASNVATGGCEAYD